MATGARTWCAISPSSAPFIVNQGGGERRNYVVDGTGKKKAVIIDSDEFNKLVEYIEEIEDALDLKKAVEQGKEFVELRDFMQRMSQEGRL